MQLGLQTIAKLGAQGNSKSAVVTALFATKNYQGAIGTYGFDKNGDTTLKSYGLYKVGSDGNPTVLQDHHRSANGEQMWSGAVATAPLHH